MKVCVLSKKGILECTAKVLLEALLDFEEVPLDEAEIVFNFSKNNSGKGKYVNVFKESNPSTFLARVIEEACSCCEVNSRVDNLKYFAQCFSETESSSFISGLTLDYMSKVNEIDDKKLLDFAKDNVNLNSEVDKFLGPKIHLYANNSKLDSYYKWLLYKFKNLRLHCKSKGFKYFFTSSEVVSFYRSLASKMKCILEMLDAIQIDEYERYNSNLGRSEFIHVFEVKTVNRAFNEVLLNCLDGETNIVCAQASTMALCSRFDSDYNVVHTTITNKQRLKRLVESIEPLIL